MNTLMVLVRLYTMNTLMVLVRLYTMDTMMVLVNLYTTNNRYTFIFQNTSSENEFPLAATPADKKLIYNNQIYSDIIIC